MEAATVQTQPIEGQKPGTSGLRKKTKVDALSTTIFQNHPIGEACAYQLGKGGGNCKLADAFAAR
eukprot:2826942-Amphidinium_carterae.1